MNVVVIKDDSIVYDAFDLLLLQMAYYCVGCSSRVKRVFVT